MNPLPKFVVAGIAAVALFAGGVRAEKALSTKAELAETATHIVVGKVRAIYSRQERRGDYEYTHFLAEVLVDRVEKGELAGGPIYVRYFDIRWKGKGDPPPGPGGHLPPKLGARHRFYLARNAYDGFSNDNRDGGLNVVYVNGVQPAGE